MSIAKQELNFLTNTLMKEVAAYGILEISLGQYQTVCKKIVAFAHSSDTTFYDSDLPDRFVLHINNQIKEGSICPEYGRFQKRVIRMLKALAETGTVDFSNAKPIVRKYPVPEEIVTLVEEILNENNISETTKLDLRAPMRHLFWYAEEQGYHVERIGDSVIMKLQI